MGSLEQECNLVSHRVTGSSTTLTFSQCLNGQSNLPCWDAHKDRGHLKQQATTIASTYPPRIPPTAQRSLIPVASYRIMSDALPNTPAQHAQQNQPWYQKGALPLGSCIGGIPIYLHWSFFALLLIMLLSTLISNADDPAYWGIILLLYGPILLVTIIIVSKH